MIEAPPLGQLSFDRPGGSEAVAGPGTNQPIGLRPPDRARAQDLTPRPVRSVDEVGAQVRVIPGARIADARLAVEALR
ncbi:hypothetical protein [Rhodopila globiformis]|uniref:Uncharacterized protein n=1 Tax=Rhodopila globiformis TaxID=1071 RepID=A0A2S6NIM5_RHOGL|nr:hypothetical protein [Rhodopila globiformis]PPQ34467.1 hypothetical protein CCS01_10720 [Rhodopila globiformis]